MNELRFMVAGMSCGHCANAITVALAGLPGITSVEIDVTSAWVIVRGHGFEFGAVEAAVNTSGHIAQL
jgi:copper chaperone CopZ